MSALSRALSDYLRLRRSFGHELADAHRLLPRFVDHMEAIGVEFVTIDAAVAWSLEANAPPGSTVPARRMMAVRGFARYLRASTHVPRSRLLD